LYLVAPKVHFVLLRQRAIKVSKKLGCRVFMKHEKFNIDKSLERRVMTRSYGPEPHRSKVYKPSALLECRI